MPKESIVTTFDEDGTVAGATPTPEAPPAVEENPPAAEALSEDEPSYVRPEPSGEDGDDFTQYSEKVQKRIKRLTKEFHDERRAREVAEHQYNESVRYAQSVNQHNEQLRRQIENGTRTFFATAQASAERGVELARGRLRSAVESNDPAEMAKAQEELAKATFEVESVRRALGQVPQQPQGQPQNFSQPPLQQQQNPVYHQPTQPQSAAQPVDRKAVDWAERNPWFMKDSTMTGYALGLHEQLVRDGFDPASDEYYETLDSNLQRVFPGKVPSRGTLSDTPTPQASRSTQRQRPSTVVAPASRSAPGKRVVLTPTQRQLIRKLGITEEAYAQQMELINNG